MDVPTLGRDRHAWEHVVYFVLVRHVFDLLILFPLHESLIGQTAHCCAHVICARFLEDPGNCFGQDLLLELGQYH